MPKNIIIIILTAFFFSFVEAKADNKTLLLKIISEARQSESSSLVIVQNGKVIYSDFFGGSDTVQNVASITKSICAVAIGILIEQKKISSLDTPMSQWIPSWSSDLMKSKITLRMILNHTSGLPDEVHHNSDSVPNLITVPNFFYHDDLVKAAIPIPLIATPGTQFVYSSIGTTLLQSVISQTSGMSVSEFVKRSFFFPIGIYHFKWEKDKVGNEITSGGLHLSTKDLLKIGNFMLYKGKVGNNHILNSAILDTLITQSQSFYDYGLMWWLSSEQKVYFAKGYGGQYIVVFPQKDLVAVRTKKLWQQKPQHIELGKFKSFPDLISQWE